MTTTTSDTEADAIARRLSRRSAWLGHARTGAALLLAVTTAVTGPLVAIPVAAQKIGTEAGATIDEILDNPTLYYGRTVTVSGEVAETLGPRSFRLEDSDLLFGEAIPVIGARPLLAPGGREVGADFFADQTVQVTGEVRQFDLGAFEAELGVDLDDDAWGEFAGQPAILAQSVVAAEDDGLGADLGVNRGVGVGAGALGVGDILADPNQFYGQATPLTFTGTVDRALGPRSFLVRGPNNQWLPIIVMSEAGPIDVNNWVGQEVQVTGAVNQFNLGAFEDRLGLDLDDQVWAPYAGQPAVIANSVVGAGAGLGAGIDPGLGADVNRILGITPGAAPVTNVTIDDILDDPAAYAGQYVSVVGEIEEVTSGRSFTIEDDDLMFSEELRVIGARELPGLGPVAGGVGEGVGAGDGVGEGIGEGFGDGDQVRVNGVVRTFNLAAFERDFGVDLDDNLYSEWEGQPVLVATELTRAVGEAGVGN